MKNRWLPLVSWLLVIFAGLVMAWQVVHRNRPGEEMAPESCIGFSWNKAQDLAKFHELVPRAGAYWPGVGTWWTLDLALPEDARVFMTDMTGATNYFKTSYYYSASYYLFPREIGVSVDRPTALNQNGFLGETSRSDQEILAHGYDVRLDFGSGEKMHYKALRELPLRKPVDPDWFDSAFDTGIAFALPLFTALAGMWLLRFLFPGLAGRMPLPEQLAYASGLGMMTVAALTLGIKLCGWHGYHLVYVVTGIGTLTEIWHNCEIYVTAITAGCRKVIHHPVTLALLVAGTLVFLVLFRLAGLQGLVDLDAAMAWMLKAKMLHLYTGSELIHWFSNPCFANSHLDYPTLVPALHAATYDSLGHVDEFVTKFWPTWMLLFLLTALASLNRNGSNRLYAPWFGLLGLLLLPATQKYAQMEGGTLPMVFFTILGSVQCALWLMEKDRARLGLGLTLLFGAAMTKFEGSIFLVLIGGSLLLMPAAHSPLKPSPRFWRVAAFCFLAALPFFGLRFQIPSMNYESSWAGHVLSHPGTILSMLTDWIRLFMVQLTRLFVNPGFASWSGEDGQLHWNGRWDGLSSLYNPSTLGLAWLCLLLTLAVWFVLPARRWIAIWSLSTFIAAVGALSGVFASFVRITSLDSAISFTVDAHGTRYLLPMLLAWFATVMTLCFREEPASCFNVVASDTVPANTKTGLPTPTK
jgi:hypothetical protein